MIHISSFQESVRAREEIAFLESREFPVYIVFLDLGPKGKWYRVYSGPFRTREEAREVKKNLDAVPQVRFTRITKIPE
jgi:cell division septation protein DedD